MNMKFVHDIKNRVLWVMAVLK